MLECYEVDVQEFSSNNSLFMFQVLAFSCLILARSQIYNKYKIIQQMTSILLHLLMILLITNCQPPRDETIGRAMANFNPQKEFQMQSALLIAFKSTIPRFQGQIIEIIDIFQQYTSRKVRGGGGRIDILIVAFDHQLNDLVQIIIELKYRKHPQTAFDQARNYVGYRPQYIPPERTTYVGISWYYRYYRSIADDGGLGLWSQIKNELDTVDYNLVDAMARIWR